MTLPPGSTEQANQTSSRYERVYLGKKYRRYGSEKVHTFLDM